MLELNILGVNITYWLFHSILAHIKDVRVTRVEILVLRANCSHKRSISIKNIKFVQDYVDIVTWFLSGSPLYSSHDGFAAVALARVDSGIG